MFEIYLRHGFLLVLVISGVPLVVASICGLIVSTVQSATQIQEQSVSIIVKFLAICAVFALFGRYGLTELINFIQESLASLASLGRL